MVPTSFDEENTVLDTPPGLSPELCAPLPVWVGSTTDGLPVVVSCWKLTQEELKEIQQTGRVWITVLGVGMQPIMPSGYKPIERAHEDCE